MSCFSGSACPKGARGGMFRPCPSQGIRASRFRPSNVTGWVQLPVYITYLKGLVTSHCIRRCRKEDPVGWLRFQKRRWRETAEARKRRRVEAAQQRDRGPTGPQPAPRGESPGASNLLVFSMPVSPSLIHAALRPGLQPAPRIDSAHVPDLHFFKQ